ncbi:MAG: hypothetical protein II921_03745 [Treponema sp.]|nr:hypothetical protein [Treponema sp.]
MTKRTAARILALFCFVHGVVCETLSVDYYGVVSSSSEKNIMKMVQDAFLAQLKSIDGVSVSDKRKNPSSVSSSAPSIAQNPTDKNTVAFYSEIVEVENKDKSKSWNCTFFAFLPNEKKPQEKHEYFESYYKIIAKSKNEIHDFLSSLSPKKSSQGEMGGALSNGDVGELAGTWCGEPHADRVVILRNGTGFVVFKDGTLMNISVSLDIDETAPGAASVKISQVGESRPSFYPELPSEAASGAALLSEPIVWHFTYASSDSDTLSGTKNTLVPSGARVLKGSTPAVWTRR